MILSPSEATEGELCFSLNDIVHILTHARKGLTNSVFKGLSAMVTVQKVFTMVKRAGWAKIL